MRTASVVLSELNSNVLLMAPILLLQLASGMTQVFAPPHETDVLRAALITYRCSTAIIGVYMAAWLCAGVAVLIGKFRGKVVEAERQ